MNDSKLLKDGYVCLPIRTPSHVDKTTSWIMSSQNFSDSDSYASGPKGIQNAERNSPREHE